MKKVPSAYLFAIEYVVAKSLKVEDCGMGRVELTDRLTSLVLHQRGSWLPAGLLKLAREHCLLGPSIRGVVEGRTV